MTTILRSLFPPCAAALLCLHASVADAHDGRRFEIAIQDDALVAQGVITTGVDDGGGVVRPYTNVIHDHWENSALVGDDSALATLPGFDISAAAADALQSQTLWATFLGATKWENPPLMPTDSDVPVLAPLDGESLSVAFDGASVSADAPGSLLLAASVTPGGMTDLDPLYTIDRKPSGVLYALEFRLETSAPQIGASESVYMILAPDGADAEERLHHASLFLESYLATRVPEPTAGGCLAVALSIAVAAGARTRDPVRRRLRY